VSHLVSYRGAYNPDEVAIMSAAFDMAYASLSTPAGNDVDLCGALARAILRQVNQGEYDPTRISELACNELRQGAAAGQS
jgi:hypothetical protein